MPSSIQIIVVVGGMGASTAYHLAPRDFTDVLLLEKQKFFGIGATGICAGGADANFPPRSTFGSRRSACPCSNDSRKESGVAGAALAVMITARRRELQPA